MLDLKSRKHRKKHHSREGIIGTVYLAQSPGEISPTNIIRSWISLLRATHTLGRLESLIGSIYHLETIF